MTGGQWGKLYVQEMKKHVLGLYVQFQGSSTEMLCPLSEDLKTSGLVLPTLAPVLSSLFE